LEKLLTDAALRTRIGEKARLFARANFMIEHVTKQYEELYLELLAGSKWRPKSRWRF
jgi:glycosyltransferase involved in cell wall biosynthesis